MSAKVEACYTYPTSRHVAAIGSISGYPLSLVADKATSKIGCTTLFMHTNYYNAFRCNMRANVIFRA
ncbi:hypothetical protein POSPLADRAFT_1169088 [Postia placenta MAD-698-R-SB12]|uniref:Uncharacterized protein n=1 Tax=Postia placenta MAD-698-R-SB12 TaxID=670580 RepID=A0A1X6N510_9APHY|nr:hypothetical protein POSPLADRAFT_1169088 [Postia placenta MAD-698-R-SB12]OSX63695.1 hypothetical protein POSPLADRAFT_1169088 [Postia placenta MAD-698-R-SB12]